jgi:sarcosine oxidase, subunit gamma
MAEPRIAGSTVPSWVGDGGTEPLAQLDVRADAPAARALRLPREPNTVVAEGERHTLWLGPDEWLVVEPGGDPAAIAAELEGCAEGWVTTVDLSSNRVAFDTTRDVLAGGCALDLHPRVFGPGRCAQTLLARAPVILEALPGGAFRVLARASFAAYVGAWLLDAASAQP